MLVKGGMAHRDYRPCVCACFDLVDLVFIVDIAMQKLELFQPALLIEPVALQPYRVSQLIQEQRTVASHANALVTSVGSPHQISQSFTCMPAGNKPPLRHVASKLFRELVPENLFSLLHEL